MHPRSHQRNASRAIVGTPRDPAFKGGIQNKPIRESSVSGGGGAGRVGGRGGSDGSCTTVYGASTAPDQLELSKMTIAELKEKQNRYEAARKEWAEAVVTAEREGLVPNASSSPEPTSVTPEDRCTGCKKPIGEENAVTALGKIWHREHFTCSICNEDVNKKFFNKDDKLYCEYHYHDKYSPRCAKCNNPAVTNAVTALGKTWHRKHFTCSICNQELDKYIEKDGQLYCESDYYQKVSPRCAKCNDPVVGNVVTALGKIWHREHFTCIICKQKPYQFSETDGELYCEYDYHQKFSPRCAKCNEPVVDNAVTALGKTWHRKHFTCSICARELDKYAEKDGQLYCESDYRKKFAPRCAKCNDPVVGNDVTALGKIWHREHFTCSMCNEQLVNYFEKDNQLYCESDYHNKFAPRCPKCNDPVVGNEVSALGKTWHRKHFTCSICNQELEQYIEKDGQLYCESDYYENVSPRCAKCNDPIVSNKVSALGKTWHQEHFTCCVCDEDVRKNYAYKDEQLYCTYDYHEKFSPRCAKCNNRIVGEYLNALDRCWHIEHFCCAQCEKTIGKNKYYVENDKPYCCDDYFNMFALKCAACKLWITGKYTCAENSQWHIDCFVCNDCHQPLLGSIFFENESILYCESHYRDKGFQTGHWKTVSRTEIYRKHVISVQSTTTNVYIEQELKENVVEN